MDTTDYFRLSNKFLGFSQALSLGHQAMGSLRMTAVDGSPEQLWRLRALGSDQFSIHCEALGDPFALDVVASAGAHWPVLALADGGQGQRWNLEPQSNGTVKLVNAQLGPGIYLDTTGDTQEPIFTGANSSGQYWSLVPIKPVEVPVAIPELEPGGWVDGTEGPTDFKFYTPATGARRALLLFVDFDDAEGEPADPQDLGRQLLGDGLVPRLFAEQSHGRLVLEFDVAAGLGWRRMPCKVAEYGDVRRAHDPHRRYVEDALRLFARDVDFSGRPLVVVANPPLSTSFPAATYHAGAGNGISVGTESVLQAVTLSGHSHENPRVLVHEMGHLFGLPDLYLTDPSGHADFTPAGAWCLMSNLDRAGSFLGWHRHKCGWLAEERETFLARGTTDWQATVHALSRPRGLAMVVLDLGLDTNGQRSKVAVVELAQPADFGQKAGVLVYTVDARIPTGKGPIEVLTNGSSLDEAPVDVGQLRRIASGSGQWTIQPVGHYGDSLQVAIGFQ